MIDAKSELCHRADLMSDEERELWIDAMECLGQVRDMRFAGHAVSDLRPDISAASQALIKLRRYYGM